MENQGQRRPQPKPKPYPMPDNLRPNQRYARILLNCYSGRDSELTTIHQYIYHYMTATQDYPQIAKAIHAIAVVEMYHLTMLGECIQMLGTPPRFTYRNGNRRVFWNSGLIAYGKTLREMLEADRRGELAAIDGYERAIRQIEEPQLQKLLTRLLEDEQAHAAILAGLLKQV